MAAAQVAKKLKDKRKQRTIEGIFKKVRAVPRASWTERELYQLVSNVVGGSGGQGREWHNLHVWILRNLWRSWNHCQQDRGWKVNIVTNGPYFVFWVDYFEMEWFWRGKLWENKNFCSVLFTSVPRLYSNLLKTLHPKLLYWKRSFFSEKNISRRSERTRLPERMAVLLRRILSKYCGPRICLWRVSTRIRTALSLR